MTPQRAQRLLQGQSGFANKLYAAVPRNEPWSLADIQIEYRRQTGHPVSPDQALGAMRYLIDAGLVKEGPMKHFVSTVKVKEAAVSKASVKVEEVSKQSLADRLINEAVRLESAALELRILAEDLQAKEEQLKAGFSKVDRFKDLMRELTDA